ncbi:MAG: hypothetical protein EPO39_14985, partial [Candidatus Manganitrophaceae bacterium]
MAIILPDDIITGLLHERKPLPSDYKTKIHLKPRRGHKEQELNLKGADGNEFRIILRQSDFNTLDFSVILAYILPNSNQLFRLRRYNGKSHEHTNKIENEKFYGFHIHQATARYQELGKEEDSYAIPTDHFTEYQGAIQ